MCALNCPRGLGCRRGSWPKCGHVGFSQKGYHFFGQPDPPPRDMLSSPQTPYTGGLRAFGATRVCHPGVTGGPHLAEKVVPSEPVADIIWIQRLRICWQGGLRNGSRVSSGLEIRLVRLARWSSG